MILSAIISSEFGNYQGYEMEAYGEALEALSMEYFSSGEQTPCGGSCATIGDQIIWLKSVESFRKKNFSNLPLFNFSQDALSVMDENYQYGEKRESWIWGNYNTDSKLDIMIGNGQGKNIYYVVAVDYNNFIVATSAQNYVINTEHLKDGGQGDYWK